MIGFLHTAAVHRGRFDELVRELAPGVEVVSDVRTDLLVDARAQGPDSPAVVAGVIRSLRRLEAAGCEVVVCTCSTIGGVAERVGLDFGVPVVRVDRPMAERAVGLGGTIVVLAALESTLVPTEALIRSVAGELGCAVDVDLRLVDGAWDRFVADDAAGYVAAVAAAIEMAVVDAGVVVLAQASMAAAADRVDAVVLSSPRLGVERAIDLLRGGRAAR